MNQFKDIPNRDAYATIRGFVYQVDHTILKWIDLNDDEILELERGEDIDLIAGSLTKDDINRKLEQIKHRDSNISLNSPEILESIVNFHTHRLQNPSINLFFRFVTNSKSVREKPNIFNNNLNGIETWMKIHAQITTTIDLSTLEDIKQFLIRKSNDIIKSDTNSNKSIEYKNWSSFNDFINKIDYDNLISFIKSFEISTNNQGSTSIRELIIYKIIEVGYCTDNESAEHLYHVMFFEVFKILSIKGLKQLKRANLNSIINNIQNYRDDLSFNILINTFRNIEDRISNLESSHNTLENSIANIDSKLHTITSYKDDFNISYINDIPTNPPIQMSFCCSRKRKVDLFIKQLSKIQWLALQSEHGLGKSQIAILISKRFTSSYWLDLKPFSDGKILITILNTFISKISGIAITSNYSEFYREAFNNIPADSLIVINNLPYIDVDSAFSSNLRFLISSLGDKKLLTTSNFQINNIFKMNYKDIFIEFNDLHFGDDEILELLYINGANHKSERLLEFFKSLSINHPRIVNILVNKLKDRNWQMTKPEFVEMYAKLNFQENDFEDIQRLIINSIENAEERRLLYRMSLCNWEMDLSDINYISQVSDKILFPNEKLNNLVGPWIRANNYFYSISPLIYRIGINNLTIEEVQNVYLAIVNSLFLKSDQSLITLLRIINLLNDANKYNDAGYVLYQILRSAVDYDHAQVLLSWGCLHYWNNVPFPEDMNPNFQIAIKFEQLRLFSILKIETVSLVAQLEDIAMNALKLNDISSFTNAQLKLIFHHKLNLMSVEFLAYSKYYRMIYEEWVPQEEAFLSNYHDLQRVLFTSNDSIKSINDLAEWMSIVNIYEERFVESFFSSTISLTNLENLTIIVFYNNSSEEEKGIDFLLDFLNKRKIRSEESIVRVLVTVSNCKLNKSSSPFEVSSFCDKWLYALSDDSSIFELAKEIGKLLILKDVDISVRWLNIAYEIDLPNQHSTSYIELLTNLSIAYSSINLSKSISYINQAIRLANGVMEFNQYNYMNMLGERAILLWMNKDFQSSFNDFEYIIIKLFSTKKEDLYVQWVRIFKLTCNFLGYISKEISHEYIDSEKITRPYSGVYYYNDRDFTDIYNLDDDFIAYGLLASYCFAIDNTTKAFYWLDKAFDETKVYKNQDKFLMNIVSYNQYLLIHGYFDRAFKYSLMWNAITTFNKEIVENKVVNKNKLSYFVIKESKPSQEWNFVEEATLIFIIFPFLVLASMYKEDNKEKSVSHYNLLINTLIEYKPESSSSDFFEYIISLVENLYFNKLSIHEMYNKAIEFNDQNNQIAILYLYGCLNQTRDIKDALTTMVSIIPTLMKYFSTSKAVIDRIIAPYIKRKIIMLYKIHYVGTTKELDAAIHSIESVNLIEPNSINTLIRFIIDEFSDEVPETSNGLW